MPPLHKLEALGPWALFLGGQWTKTRPREPGYYPVATREGASLVPSKWRLLYHGPEPARILLEGGVGHAEPGWQGWWWNRPVPILPRAPNGEW